MEEKKLTDEEVVKALELMATSESGTSGLTVNVTPYALDLIRRLQNEVSQWKSKAEHIEEVYDADREHFIKTTTEQKAEIERLTEAHKKDTMLLYASGLACEQVKAENTKLQKQVNKLKEENEYLDIVAKQALADYQNAQVQVDELTDKLGKVLLGVKADELLVAKGVEQAVKDTAKEIFTQIFESCVFSFKGNEDYKKGFCDALEQYDKQLRDLAKQNGVEVE